MWPLANHLTQQFIERGLWGLGLTIALLVWRAAREQTLTRLRSQRRS
jgi:hypothetical protein